MVIVSSVTTARQVVELSGPEAMRPGPVSQRELCQQKLERPPGIVREGNSCHIHISLRSQDGDSVLAGDGPHGFSLTMEHFLAGLLASQKELTYFFAPNINSYKRFVPGSFAPTAIAWGVDNRSCAFRVVGHGESLRVEDRVAGGDVNLCLAVAALIAAGLHGIENELPLGPVFTGNAYDSDMPRVPENLRDAADLLAQSKIALAAFGPEVVEHYLNAARVELAAYDAAVTGWERFRGPASAGNSVRMRSTRSRDQERVHRD